jgi:hypothetical protein
MLEGMGDPTPPWREPFEQALDADPSDRRVRRDLADHLDELGDPDGDALRWLADNGKWPTPPGVSHPFFDATRSWDWWWEGSSEPPDSGRLPQGLYDRLPRGPGVGETSYYTRREAEAAFCRAFHAARAAGWVPDSG